MNDLRESVALCYLHSHAVTAIFADSIFRTYEFERDSGSGRLWRTLSMSAGAMQLDRARNQFASRFLDECDKDWLWMVDSDIGFPPSTLGRLQDAAIANNLDAIAGLYNGVWGRQTHQNGAVDFDIRPLTFMWDADAGVMSHVELEWDRAAEGDLVEVDGTGAGCMLIRRSTLEAVRAEFNTWFDGIDLPVDGAVERLSEDLAFCLRLRQLGLRLAVDAGAGLVHQKPTWV